jgi:DNA polymerase-4
MDAFYASIEQRDRPELRGRPVIVGGTRARGVVSAASYEARTFGVRSAMPTYEARRLCPEGVFLPGSMARYARESRRVFEIFRRAAPVVEGLSLDEAFLDLSGTERLLGPARGVAARLREAVRAELSLTVSVGIAPIKLAARIASDLAKPDGLLEVAPAELRGFLDPLPVGRLFGIGPVAEARCHRAGIHTIGELARLSTARLAELFGPGGAALSRLARGDDGRTVVPERDAVSYSEENTFAADVSAPAVLEGALIAHAEAVARRLRRDGLTARVVAVKLKLARRTRAGPRGYPLLTRRVTLGESTDDGTTLGRAALRLLHGAALTEPVRLIGLVATRLGPAPAQLALFAPPEDATRRKRLYGALDQIADRFGDGAVVRGGPQERAGLTTREKRGVRP